jgi:hypothetical protein
LCPRPYSPLPPPRVCHPRWCAANATWSAVTSDEAARLAPHVHLKVKTGNQVQSLRVFASGSVIQIGRWPVSMSKLYARFVAYAATVYPHIVEPEYTQQRRLTDMWAAPHAAEEDAPTP